MMKQNMVVQDIDTEAIKDILSLPIQELLARADETRRKNIGCRIELCSIINAKSGACSEDCKFCAQSAHHHADIPEYPLKSKREMLIAAKEALKNGAERFGIVTSGNALTKEEVKKVADAVREINRDIGISACASLGTLDEESFSILKEAGLRRYHHNIETSKRFYKSIVSTHDYSQRINTIRTAKKMGFEVCSGGIIGMGEDWDDRVDMAFLLKELDVDSVPINILVPISGTPMENCERMSPMDAIRTIAMFRIILKDKAIKVAAGRESALKDFQALAYMAGANGMLVGGYLTVSGRPVKEDLALMEEVNKLWRER